MLRRRSILAGRRLMAKKSAKKASKKSAKRPAKKAKKAAKKSAAKALKKAKKAAEKAAQKKRPAPHCPLGDYVQAHLGRPSKFADGKTRNWTAFYFFRILSQANVEANAAALGKLKALLGSPDRSETTLRNIRETA